MILSYCPKSPAGKSVSHAPEASESQVIAEAAGWLVVCLASGILIAISHAMLGSL